MDLGRPWALRGLAIVVGAVIYLAVSGGGDESEPVSGPQVVEARIVSEEEFREVTADAALRHPDSIGSTQADFCESSEFVEDFGLASLPPTREAPADGDLPFGPKTVSLSFANKKVLAVGEGIGFWVHSQNYVGRTPLRWIVRHRLRTVDDSGGAGPVIARGRQRVRLIHAGREVKLFLDPPKTPGFYRYEIEIVEFEGKRLALYGSNLRVERKFWDVRLRLNRAVFHPGNHVRSRIENFGTISPYYGYEFRIQRQTARGWVHVRNPNRVAWPLVGLLTGPGQVGPCSTFSLPRDFPPDRYRIVKEVERYLHRGRTRTEYLTAPFDVIRSHDPM